MLTVKFSSVRGEAYVVGPRKEIRFFGGELWGDVDEKPLATHVGHQWKTEKGRFTRLDIAGPLLLHLRTGDVRSKAFGPYKELSAVDGVMYVEGRVFAFCEEQERGWYAFEDGRHWSMVIARHA